MRVAPNAQPLSPLPHCTHFLQSTEISKTSLAVLFTRTVAIVLPQFLLQWGKVSMEEGYKLMFVCLLPFLPSSMGVNFKEALCVPTPDGIGSI